MLVNAKGKKSLLKNTNVSHSHHGGWEKEEDIHQVHQTIKKKKTPVGKTTFFQQICLYTMTIHISICKAPMQ